MKHTVLLVDDNEALVETLRDGLTAATPDCNVLTASSVDAATELLDASPVDLVVTDVNMPGKSGFDLLAHLIEYHPETRVIVMTGFGTPDMERRARELGSLRFLAKPLEIADLKREIDSVLDGAASGALLEVVSQAGFLQLLALERTTCLVTFTTAQATATLTFVDGHLCDAKAGELHGEEAVFAVLEWKAPRIAVGKLRRKPSPRHKLGLQGLLLEAARRDDERSHTSRPGAAIGTEVAPAANPAEHVGAATHETVEGSAGGGDAPVGGVPGQRDEQKRRKQSETAAPTYDTVTSQPRKEQKMALETHLEELKSINGYLACGIMNFTGEILVSDSTSKSIDLALVGATFNDIFRSAHEASKKIGFEACRETVIATPTGIVIMRCTGADRDPHIHFVAVMKADGNKALMEMQLKKLEEKVVAELS